jgi:ABC-2 type transport system permease protein
MTTTTDTAPTPLGAPSAARKSFLSDLSTVAGRALRAIPREPESIIPALMIPLFFFVVYLGALQDIAEENAPPGFDFKAFQLPVAIVFAVTGVSRAAALVTDIQSGYFDRLVLSPVRRSALLLGLMIADLVLVCALCVPVVILGLFVGVRFATGPLGMVVFILLGGLWGLAFTGFPYAIALKTGNPAAVNTSFLLFFPFAFLTTSQVPEEVMTGWLRAVAQFNPITYLLEGMRSLVSEGWNAASLAKALAAIAALGVVSFPMAFATLKGRLDRS